MDQVLLIVLFATIAALIGVRLYMVLGQRPDEDMTPQPKPLGEATPMQRAVDELEDEVHFTGPGAATMHEIRNVDGQFDPDGFIIGARQAYVMIGEAFARGDREALRPLLSEDVFAQWSAAIDAREAEGHTQSFSVRSLNNAQIDDVEFDGRIAQIDVEFDVDIISVTSDGDGNPIQGEPDVARRVHEIWSFERAVDASRPDWTLTQVRAG